MELALCHVIPRDIVLQLVLLLLFASCIVQLLIVSSYGGKVGLGDISLYGSSNSSVNTVFISTRSTLYVSDESVVCHMESHAGFIHASCARFVSSFRVACGLFLASFMVSIIGFIANTFFVVPLSKTTMFVLASEVILFVLPFALHSTGVIVFFHFCIYNAKKTIRAVVSSDGDLHYRFGYLSILMVVSEVLLLIGFVISTGRYVCALVCRRSLKQRDIVRGDIGHFMQHHLVNDDWERQKNVLKSHARSVQLEIVVHVDSGSGKDESFAGTGTGPGTGTGTGDEGEGGSPFFFRTVRCLSLYEMQCNNYPNTTPRDSEPTK
ncbi:hypothetical protein ERJ75_000978500 [Trypanosoma vivax]|uniref:Uncharacterized protein n=1 Tax=Trypanosoma vivax (strain Y486) TaxID=1055687 RepID=G0U6T1_TRYVY|nr:hypothetical protein TRVL_02675 [Trypanosoma vivax]KAH8611196.1 hypothetical protein ERJ75_000978500 [Trypanosoma vivax]CCC51586.1 conserved hypothetical protein [Trypanosoma vivax Y486]